MILTGFLDTSRHIVGCSFVKFSGRVSECVTQTQPMYSTAELLPTHLSFDLLSDSDYLFSHRAESPLS